MQCLLCHSQEIRPVRHISWPGPVFHCQKCDLIFKSSADFLNWDEQKTRYDQHENSIDNPGYKEFFEKLLKPLRTYVVAGMRSLDWGAGPGPVLSQLLSKDGLKTEIFDPVYQPQKPNPAEPFDLITSTEVLEHFQEPELSLLEIDSYLKKGGIFAGMTQFHTGPAAFQNWWYAKDPTHVVFYSEKTLKWWADKQGYQILKLDSPVFIFRKAT